MNLHESIRNDLRLFEDERYNEDDQRVLSTLDTFRTLYAQLLSIDNNSGYILGNESTRKNLRDVYHATIESHFPIRSGKREGIPDLDGSQYDHPID